MKVLAELLTSDGGKGYVFYCPACKHYHNFTTEAGSDKSRPVWAFNGNLEKPTFSPSLGVNMMVPEARCHTFVRDGRIQYLSDCFHEFAGKTIDMEEIDR